MLARVRVGTTYSPARYLAQRIAPIPLVRQAAFSSTDASDPPLIHHLDLRVGKIVHVEAHAQADHLYVEQVDLGDHPPRTIVSGLNKQVVVVSNMKPSKFRGTLSQGMLLAVSKDDRVELLEPPQGSIVGERVEVDGMDPLAPPDEVLKPKQRVMERVAEHLLTNDQCIATWKNMPLKTNAGFIRCNTIQNGQIS
ncbi:hypothetical protein Unana1_04195 [Umbelopsis nana]